MLIEQGNRGTRLGRGCSGADADGWAKDDPPTEAQYECFSCKEVKPQSEMWDNELCLDCEEGGKE